MTSVRQRLRASPPNARHARSDADLSWLSHPPTFGAQDVPVQESERAASESDMRCTLPLHRAALRGSARPPQAAHLHLELFTAMWTLCLHAGVPVLVDVTIKVLQIIEVCCEEPFDNFRIDNFQ